MIKNKDNKKGEKYKLFCINDFIKNKQKIKYKDIFKKYDYFDIVGYINNGLKIPLKIRKENIKCKNHPKNKKLLNILILEDEEKILNDFFDVIEYKNSRIEDFFINPFVLTSLRDDIVLNLNLFDYIFIDRDNELGMKLNNFHDCIIPQIEQEIFKKKDINNLIKFLKKIYFVSGSGVNNNYIKNIIIKISLNHIFGKKGIYKTLKKYNEVFKKINNVLDNNILTKSLFNIKENLKIKFKYECC